MFYQLALFNSPPFDQGPEHQISFHPGFLLPQSAGLLQRFVPVLWLFCFLILELSQTPHMMVAET
jgi:hypothetical protein